MPALAEGLPLKVVVAGETRVVSMEELESIGVSGFRTTTTWTDGAQEFTGVLLSDIATANSVSTGTVIVKAINDYQAEIELAEIMSAPVLLATRMNGERMSVRDKGPYWVVYPRDDHPEFADERHNFKWVWQVDSLEFK